MVRNVYNIPQDQNDGAVVLNQATRAGLSYLETGASPGFNYYTIFGCDSSTGVWVRCSDLIAILPINWGAGDRMYNLLPAIYSDRDIVLVDPYNPWPNSPGIPPLQRFLSLLGFQLDFIRTEMESLLSVNDAHRVSGALLPLLAYQLGMPFEGEIGMQQARGLVANAMHLYKLKGSAQGISEYCSLLTGYPTALTLMGHNKLLCTDDSIGAQTTGTWQPWPPAGTKLPAIGGENSSLSLAQIPDLVAAGTSDPTTIIGAAPPGYVTGHQSGMAIRMNTGPSTADLTTGPVPTLDFLGPWRSVPNNMPNQLTTNMSTLESGSLGSPADWGGTFNCSLSVVTTQAHSGTHSLMMSTTAVGSGACYCSGPTDTTRISVTPGQTLTASAWVRAGASAESCHISLGFYTSASVFIVAPTSTQVTSSTTAWTQITISSIVPSNAAYANLWLAMDSITAAGEAHYWDDMTLYLGTPLSTVSSYTPGSVTWRFQIYTPFGKPSRTVTAGIAGDVGASVRTNVVPTTAVATVPGSWVQITATGPVLPPCIVVQNPDGSINTVTNYYYLYPWISIAGMAGSEVHYYTLGMLWNEPPTYPTLPAYDYPRDLKVIMEPLSANLLANPLTFPTGWTHGLDGWTSLPNPVGNLLTSQQASLELATTAGWANVANTNLSNTNLQAYDGLHSLQMSSQAVGVMSVATTPSANVNVVGGVSYTSSAWVRAQAHASSAQISIRWYDATNVLISTTSSVSVTDAVTSWTQLIVSGTAPSNAAHADLLVTIVAAGVAEVHYVDLIALVAGILSTSTATATLSIVPLTPGVVQPTTSPCAVPNQLPPYGSGEMRVQPLVSNPVVWGGTVNTFSPAFVSKGWWTDPNNSWWGSSAAGYTASQEWIDTVEGWFMFGGDPSGGGGYFGVGLTTIGGDWFVQPQPSTNVDCLPFLVSPAELFTFSVYARYLSVLNLSDAKMMLGFRWYFPDGTYVETTSSNFDLPAFYTDPPFFFTDEVPFEAVTGTPATSMLPFVRFPAGAPQDLFGLNAAMLSPSGVLNPFLDTHLHPGDNDYYLDVNGASYYYKRQQIRIQRLNQTLSDWIPMSTTYTVTRGTGTTALSLV